jgi:hypothetical protein
MAARICPQCRTRVDERRAKTSPYCLSCGSPLGTPPPIGFGKPAKGSALPWILGGIGVVVLLGFGVVVFIIIAVANAEPDPPVRGVDPDSGPLLEAPTATAAVSGKPPGTVKATAAPPTVTAVRPPPTFNPPTPAPTPTVLGAFPRARATNELDRVTAGLASCKRAGDPTGSGSIRVDFEPDGRVGTLLARPFSGTSTGSCVSSRFLAIKIGQFTGTTQQIQRTFTIDP